MAKKAAKVDPAVGLQQVVVSDRRDDDHEGDRRQRIDRRKRAVPVALDRRRSERRTGERRRQIDPTTCERDYDADELEFMAAIDEYKREFCRPFPTWSEVLEVVKSIGYRKVAERSVIPLNRNKANLSSSADDDDGDSLE